MLEMFKYTDKEVKTLLKSMIILVDSREQENSHITKWFDEKKIPYRVEKLETADYSFLLPSNIELGIQRDVYFDSKIILERKNSIEELSNTLVSRERFQNELIRGKDKRFILMIEETQGYEKIITHKYNTQYNEKSFLATLFTFKYRYDIDINFISKEYAGLFIYHQFYYYLRNYLLGK